MDIPKNGYEQSVISLAPIKTDMTLDEFCQSDLEGYKYVKGELVPMTIRSVVRMLLKAFRVKSQNFLNRYNNYGGIGDGSTKHP